MGIYWYMRAEYKPDTNAEWREAPNCVLWDGMGQGWLRRAFTGVWEDRYPKYPVLPNTYKGCAPESPYDIPPVATSNSFADYDATNDFDHRYGDSGGPTWWSLRELMAYEWAETHRLDFAEHQESMEEVFRIHGVGQLERGGWFKPRLSVAEEFWKSVVWPLRALVGDRLDDARIIVWVGQ